jgi:hypothetical protein
MKKALFLVLGLGAVVALAPSESQSQPGPGSTDPGGQHAPSVPPEHQPQGTGSPKAAIDAMELFDRISGGRSYITGSDIAGIDTLKTDFQTFLSTAGHGADHVTREQFYAIVEQRKEQLRLQREWLRKQIELQQQALLNGDDLATLPGLAPMPGAQGSAPHDAGGDKHKQPKGHDNPNGEHQPELTPEQLQQQQQQLQQQQAIQQQQAMVDAEIENFFRSHRLNKDGMLTKDAAEPPLKAQWDIWDFDGNGLIDSQEYRAFNWAQRFGIRVTKDGPNPFRPSWAVEPRPPVYRKGKLPTTLPSWFLDLADNEEGQVFLFDWRNAGRKDEDFIAMDLNGDGILTAAEVLDFMKRIASMATSILVVQPGSGSVTEIGPDGKPRWTLSGLTAPRDVEMLQAGIVLVAEQNQITERTITGKVLWKYPVNEPLSAQRLSNGHTFIVCPGSMIEVDRAGREVMNLPMNIACARRMADGKIVAFDRQNVMVLDSQGQLQKTARCNCGGGGNNEIMDNGHVLALSPGNGNIIEFDQDGAEVGHYDYQGAGYGFRIPGGHVFVTHQSGNEFLELDENWKLLKTTTLDSQTTKVKAGKPIESKGSGSGSGSPPPRTRP